MKRSGNQIVSDLLQGQAANALDANLPQVAL